MSAIVFNCHYNGLSIIRSLGRSGVDVIALDADRAVGAYSRYGSYRSCHDPQENEQEFIDELIAVGQKADDTPVLFPTNDQWAAAVAKHRTELEEHFELCVADWDAVKKLLKKREFYRWAEAHGYPVPKTWTFSELEEVPDSAFPLAAKPEYRRMTGTERDEGETGDFRFTVLRDRDEAFAFISENDAWADHLVLQEYVEGTSRQMFTVGIYVDRDSNLRGVFTGRKVRGYPPDVGDCNVGIEYDVPETLVDVTADIVSELGYSGIAEFEFKKDSVTGEFRLIEINPRSWSWIGITPVCGPNLPLLAYRDLRGEEIPDLRRNDPADDPVTWIRLLEDAPNTLVFNRFQGYDDYTMNPVEWWRDVSDRNVVTAEFAPDDPLPVAYSVALLAKSSGKKLLEMYGPR